MMYPTFVLTALVTLALTVRSDNGFDSGVVWWVNFLPAIAIGMQVHAYKNLKDIKFFIAALIWSILHYCLFHINYYHLPVKSLNLEFWRLSWLSLTVVTFIVWGAFYVERSKAK